MPIYVRHNIQYREGGSGKFELTIGRKHPMDKTVCVPTLFLFYLLNENYFRLKTSRLNLLCQKVYLIVF